MSASVFWPYVLIYNSLFLSVIMFSVGGCGFKFCIQIQKVFYPTHDFTSSLLHMGFKMATTAGVVYLGSP